MTIHDPPKHRCELHLETPSDWFGTSFVSGQCCVQLPEVDAVRHRKDGI